jgi:hypothetical protein
MGALFPDNFQTGISLLSLKETFPRQRKTVFSFTGIRQHPARDHFQ